MFDINKYLGDWYEVARTENEFEPNLTKVKAQYIMSGDGGIKVVNTGYVNGEMKQIIGSATTTDNKSLLKVSFFPNTYSDYKILYVDDNYQYALVGGDLNRLWILSRNSKIDTNVLNMLINIAKKYGYNIDNLISAQN